MQDILIVVDMQNDFIDGALGTPEAVSIVPTVKDVILSHKGRVIFTKDTHSPDYLSTNEGKNLPVEHCIKGTYGWEICDSLKEYANEVVEKPTFGSTTLADLLKAEHKKSPIAKITLVGLCTDICVVSNVMLVKANFPEMNVYVDASCCAGVTPEKHNAAIETMKSCQVEIRE